MGETPAAQFRRVGRHVVRESLRRALRTCILIRPFVNLYLALRTRSIIHPLARIDWNVRIGRHCFIGPATLDTLGGAGRIEIGDGAVLYAGSEILCHHGSTVRIGANCLFTRGAGAVTGGHVFDDPDATIISQGIRTADITVEDDCWIGYRAILLPGVRIGRGSIVAAGAVVARDVPAGSVVAGVPARVVRSRGPKAERTRQREGGPA